MVQFQLLWRDCGKDINVVETKNTGSKIFKIGLKAYTNFPVSMVKLGKLVSPAPAFVPVRKVYHIIVYGREPVGLAVEVVENL